VFTLSLRNTKFTVLISARGLAVTTEGFRNLSVSHPDKYWDCMTFQTKMLAKSLLLTRYLLACFVSRSALHHISHDFNCVTFVLRACRVVTCVCALCKTKYDVSAKIFTTPRHCIWLTVFKTHATPLPLLLRYAVSLLFPDVLLVLLDQYHQQT
jgi:hypothetical protein